MISDDQKIKGFCNECGGSTDYSTVNRGRGLCRCQPIAAPPPTQSGEKRYGGEYDELNALLVAAGIIDTESDGMGGSTFTSLETKIDTLRGERDKWKSACEAQSESTGVIIAKYESAERERDEAREQIPELEGRVIRVEQDLAAAERERDSLLTEIEQAKIYMREAGDEKREWSDSDNLTQWVHKFGLDVTDAAERLSTRLREGLESAINARDTELDMMHCKYQHGTAESYEQFLRMMRKDMDNKYKRWQMICCTR